MRELRERVVVITGAAGGIGRALAFAFARRGSVLALVDLDDLPPGATGEVILFGRISGTTAVRRLQ